MLSRCQKQFQTPESTCALLWEWELLTLDAIMMKTRENTLSLCLVLLILKLTDIQMFLPQQYRDNTLLRNKLLNVITEIEDFHLACHNRAESV